jgi:drug/metabolite transporter (DMT)-like permease
MKRFDLFIALIGAFLWGVSPIIGKRLLQNNSRYTIMFLISFIYFMCLLISLPFFQHEFLKDLEKMAVDDVFLLLFQGLFVVFISNVTFYYVLKHNDAAIVNAIESICPLITLLLGYWLLNEKIGHMGTIGIILIVLGVFCISYNDKNISVVEMLTERY